MEKEKDEFGARNPYLKLYINDVEVSIRALKKTCSHRAKISENQIQGIILKVTEL